MILTWLRRALVWREVVTRDIKVVKRYDLRSNSFFGVLVAIDLIGICKKISLAPLASSWVSLSPHLHAPPRETKTERRQETRSQVRKSLKTISTPPRLNLNSKIIKGWKRQNSSETPSKWWLP
jgi:hypothetical protein